MHLPPSLAPLFQSLVKAKRLLNLIVAVSVAAWCATASAQDLEPRAYSNSPIGMHFAVAGYGYTTGKVFTDPALPVDNVSTEAHVGVFALATTFGILGQSAKFDLVVPYVSLAAKGLVFGVPHARYVDGFADPAFRFSMNFIGAPALSVADFSSYRQDFILGASVRVSLPLGQYDETRLVNIGANRLAIRPEFGVSKAFGRWTVELSPGVTFYSDNNDFFGGHEREQDPIWGVQAHLSYNFRPGCWLGLDAAYFKGGRSTVDGVKNNDEHEGARLGATLAIPLTRYYSVKLYGLAGFDRHRDRDLEALGIAFQYRWGGGY